MKITPKIDTNNCRNLDESFAWLSKYDGIEVQLLSDDFIQDTASISSVIERYPNIKYFCLHAPFDHVCMGSTLASLHRRLTLLVYLKFLVTLSTQFDLSFDLLFHISMTADCFYDIGCDRWLTEVDETLRGSKVRIMLENSTAHIGYPLLKNDAVARVFEKHDFTNVVACIDICHLHISEAVWGEPVRMSDRYLSYVKNIHFAFTNAKEGEPCRNYSHSEAHPDEDSMKCDLVYVAGKGVKLKDARIVAEVREDDYGTRTNLLKQLNLMESVFGGHASTAEGEVDVS